jgi:hypothetical protein
MENLRTDSLGLLVDQLEGGSVDTQGVRPGRMGA